MYKKGFLGSNSITYRLFLYGLCLTLSNMIEKDGNWKEDFDGAPGDRHADS
jgi:hypothetical protein